jgi:hypothetical protein
MEYFTMFFLTASVKLLKISSQFDTRHTEAGSMARGIT